MLGPRTIRLIRIFRVIRLIRIVKLYKLAQEKRSIVKETTIKRAEIHFRGPQAPVLIEAPEGNKRKFEVDLDEKGVSISQSFSSLSNSSESFSDNQVVEPSTMLNQATISIQNNEAQPNEEKPIEKKIHKKVEEENKLGQHLADVTIQRVIILVLSTMLTLPLFYSGLYQKSYQSSGLGLELINEVLHDREGFNLA